MSSKKEATIELHPAFHWFGEFANHIVLKDGSLHYSMVVYRKTCSNYHHLMSRNTDCTEYGCLQCHFKGNYADKKPSNMIAHIKLKHPHSIPYEDMDESYTAAKKKEWDRIDSTKTLAVPINVPASGTKNSQKLLSSFGISMSRQKQVLCESICLSGSMALSFSANLGGRHLLSFYNQGSVPAGLGYNAIERAIVKDYTARVGLKRERIAQIKNDITLQPGRHDDIHLFRRLFSLQHDGWSNKAADPFLGVVITYLDTSVTPFRIRKIDLGAHHHPHPHTALNNLERIRHILELFNLSFEDITNTTQDTTGNSINVFDSVDVVSQLGCFGHMTQLFLKHGIENCDSLKSSIESIHDLTSMLRGSTKRKQILVECCKEASIDYRKPQLDGATRWNSKEVLLNRFIYLKPAIEKIPVPNIFEKEDIQLKFSSLKAKANDDAELIEIVLPLLKQVAQWVQVLSQSETVTISLVRVALKRIRNNISELQEHAYSLRGSSRKQNQLSDDLLAVVESLKDQFETYFGEEYQVFWVFIVGEFLDPRTHNLLSLEEKEKAIQFIKLLCTKEELNVPIRARKRKSEMSDDELLLASLGEIAAVSPIDVELRCFITMMQSETKIKDPLAFWFANHAQMKILFRIVLRVFPISPCSTDVERLFSVTGFICADHRGNLKPTTVNMLASMNSWLRDELGYNKSKRQQTSAASISRFTTINLELAFASGMEAHDEDSDDELLED
jgi:hypothetical protein